MITASKAKLEPGRLLIDGQWTDGAKFFRGGTCGGTSPRRDGPRYVRLMEAGKLDMKTMAARTYPLAQTTEAYRVAMNRTVVATIVTPNAG